VPTLVIFYILLFFKEFHAYWLICFVPFSDTRQNISGKLMTGRQDLPSGFVLRP